jgi:hypothetical protein
MQQDNHRPVTADGETDDVAGDDDAMGDKALAEVDRKRNCSLREQNRPAADAP